MCCVMGRRLRYSFLITTIISFQALAQEIATSIDGHVVDTKTHSALAGVNVFILHTAYGTTTDSLGNFSLKVRPGKYEVRFSCVGYQEQTRELLVEAGKRILHEAISMTPSPVVANEVMVTAGKYPPSPSLHTIDEKDLQYIPNPYSDVLRSVTILPGVTSNDELTSAYNVRGLNFDANLIYLNGYEIYCPYLVQQGIEESQSVINGNMVEDLAFYNGVFPAEYGDKMASVLAINYRETQDSILGGEVNADLLNSAITLHDNIGGLNWIAGFRYAYPSSFTNVLQTKGSYVPRYTDFQFLGSYMFHDETRIELLFITARNTFNLTPQDWTGDFAVGAWDAFRRIDLKFAGSDYYTYNSSLAGLKLTAPLSPISHISLSLAYYSDRESYDGDLSYQIYYSPSSIAPQDDVSDLGTGYQLAGNSLRMNRVELKTDFVSSHGAFDTKAGFDLRSSIMDNVLDESTYRVPSDGLSYFDNERQQFKFNSASAYLEENITASHNLKIDLGLRALKYYFTGEFLVSPRTSISFEPDTLNTLSFGWGYYYQPPYFYETRDKDAEEARSLRSQQDIHYVLRYDRKFHKNADVLTEIYFESLSRLLPYSYTNQMELTYSDTNNYEGYAYGFDLQYQGQLSERLNTWIGYSYLVAKDRRVGGGFGYQNSLLGQTHTVRIFLQDAMPMLHNSQAHVRLLFGTGYYYYPMVDVPGPGNSYQTVPYYDEVDQFPFYYRIDMGLTYKITLGDHRELTLSAEVLNVFNKNNIASYSWYTLTPEFSQPIRVPNLLSARFFNVGVRVDF